MMSKYIQGKNVNYMISEICKMVCKKVEGKLTVVGIKTGGEYISKIFADMVQDQGRLQSHFNIELDKQSELIIEGADLLVNDKSTYIILDDAIWSERTKRIVESELKLRHIKKVKYAVILDPYKKADFSLYS